MHMREVPFCIADLCLSHCASADVRVSVSYLAVHYLGAFSGFLPHAKSREVPRMAQREWVCQ